MNKEQIYDSEISPLMKQIIGLCKEHGIAMVASFDIGHDGEGPNGEDCSRLTCNTLLPDENDTHNQLFVEANRYIRRHGRAAPMMINTYGAGSMSSTVVI